MAVGRVTEEMENVYNTVLKAQLAGIAAANAGATGAAVDGAARQVIVDAGYGPYFGHSFGHSVGVEIHENPNATPSNSKPLPAGVVISAEPGIYLPGKLGVRIEDVIVITEQGCQREQRLDGDRRRSLSKFADRPDGYRVGGRIYRFMGRGREKGS